MNRKEFYFFFNVNEVKLSWTWMLLAALIRAGLPYNFREKIFSNSLFFPLVSALAPVSWAAEGFFATDV